MQDKKIVAVGTKLGELVKKPDRRQLFMFSAITWNRHAIHYDRQSAREEGLPDVVVQRALIGNFLPSCWTSGCRTVARSSAWGGKSLAVRFQETS
jgi:hydroxyacyl-ACP dehydratase HTD2-like protein with hotdog domain